MRDQVKLIPRKAPAPAPGQRERLPTYYDTVGGDEESEGGDGTVTAPSAR